MLALDGAAGAVTVIGGCELALCLAGFHLSDGDGREAVSELVEATGCSPHLARGRANGAHQGTAGGCALAWVAGVGNLAPVDGVSGARRQVADDVS